LGDATFVGPHASHRRPPRGGQKVSRDDAKSQRVRGYGVIRTKGFNEVAIGHVDPPSIRFFRLENANGNVKHCKLFQFGHCLVCFLNRCSFIESLVRSLEIIVMNERCKTLADALSTSHPRRMEAVDPHLKGVKLFFDVVSVGVVEPITQS